MNQVMVAIRGGLTFIAAHLVERWAWTTWFAPGSQYAPWFLNSGRAVAFTAVCLLVVSIIEGAATARDLRDAVRRAVALGVGAIVAMSAVLLSGEPGTLFPLALALGALVAETACIAGAVTAWWLRGTSRTA